MGEHERALRRAADHAVDWLDGLDDRPVGTTVGLDELRRRLDRPLPLEPTDPSVVVDDLVADTSGGLMGNAGGRFHAWVIGGTHPAALAADWLAAGWDQNAALYSVSPAMAVVEEVAGAWTIEMLGLPAESSFAFTTGCQLAHLTALGAARHRLLAGLGWDVERRGLSGGPRVHVLTGEQGHESIDRAVRTLGIGADQQHTVPTTDGRTDSGALARTLETLGGEPAIVCLAAGDINCGKFDDFLGIIPDCHARPGTWVHIDGAFGLWARVSERFGHHLDGVELADSWATDGHKWLNTPFDAGFVAVRDSEAHRASLRTSAPYLTQDVGARDELDWNIDWSRRGRAVPFYAALRGFGRSGLAALIDRCCDAAERLVSGIGTLPGAEVLSAAVTNQGLVRFLDPAGADDDAFTDEVIARLQAEGTAFFAGTGWRGRRAMRISVCSWMTSEADTERTLEAVRSVLRTAVEERAASAG